MNKSDSIKELSAALVAAQAELGAVAFDSTNPFLHNRYTSLGALIDASKDSLAKHGLAIVQLPTNDGERMAVETMILHKSGEFISDRVSLPLGDEKGKSLAQVAGSISTYMRRYAYQGALRLYGDEDTDGNAPTPPRPVSTPQKVTPYHQARPVATQDQRGRFLKQIEPVEKAALELFRAKGWIGEIDGLESLPAEHFPTTERQAKWIMEHIQSIMDGETTPEPPTGKSWRDFVLPFGKMKGKTLGDIAHNDSKYLFGLAMNYTVETEYNGKPKRAETIAKDHALRDALDEAKAELFDQPAQ